MSTKPDGFPDLSPIRPDARVVLDCLSDERIQKIADGEKESTESDTEHLSQCEKCAERFRRACEGSLEIE